MDDINAPTDVIIRREFDFFICCNDHTVGDDLVLTCGKPCYILRNVSSQHIGASGIITVLVKHFS